MTPFAFAAVTRPTSLFVATVLVSFFVAVSQYTRLPFAIASAATNWLVSYSHDSMLMEMILGTARATGTPCTAQPKKLSKTQKSFSLTVCPAGTVTWIPRPPLSLRAMRLLLYARLDAAQGRPKECRVGRLHVVVAPSTTGLGIDRDAGEMAVEQRLDGGVLANLAHRIPHGFLVGVDIQARLEELRDQRHRRRGHHLAHHLLDQGGATLRARLLLGDHERLHARGDGLGVAAGLQAQRRHQCGVGQGRRHLALDL